MSKKVIRFTGSPDSFPEQWLRINHLTEQPGPNSAYRVTIEPLEETPNPFPPGHPTRILRDGHKMAVELNAPSDTREALLEAAVRAEVKEEKT